MTAQRYMFDAANEREYRRLLEQAQVWDRLTFRRLGEIGVGEGWRCLELGPGSGTVVRWLADRVGPDGRVVAADREPKWVRTIEAPNVDVLECDINTDPLDESAYDLITVRMTVAHQPDPQPVIDELAAALVPGGWLLVEECDLRTMTLSEPPDDTWRTGGRALNEFIEQIGADPYLGPKLPGMLAKAGLADIDAEAVAFPRRMPEVPAWQGSFIELGGRLVDSGFVTAEDLEAIINRFDDTSCALIVHGPTMHSVTGRTPS